MNIRFHNLGKIKETELDLKPLTVIIGPNNSNKTYIAYSIYGLMNILDDGIECGPDLLELMDDGTFKVELTDLVDHIQREIKSASDAFVNYLPEFYQDSTGMQFAKTAFDIIFSDTELLKTLSKISGVGHMGSDGYRFQIQNDALVIYPEQRTDVIREKISRYMDGSGNAEDASFLLSRIVSNRLIFRPFLLPAERNAFITTYKILSNRRFKLLLDAQRSRYAKNTIASKIQGDQFDDSGDVRYPQPIEDFLDFLSSSEIQAGKANQDASTGEQPAADDTNNSKASFKLSADLVEREIQSGNTINFRPSSPGGHDIMVDIGEGVNIDLYNASSSIKQLAPLLLYLRQRARYGDLLIIDEPEMNLHPESQAKLLEVLAMLVNAGIYVLLTTHSPYLLSHLNNLALTEPASESKRAAMSVNLYLGDPNSFLDMDQVSAYEMRDNTLHSLKDPDFGLRWGTLSDVSGDLQQKFFRIHE